MTTPMPQSDVVVVGFDSAWTDSPKAPGAICAMGFDAEGVPAFTQPQLATFSQALEFINHARQAYSLCLVALDQPTIVPNEAGCRPVDRIAGSLISFIGGGVQPANTSKRGMFCDSAPIWTFKHALGAREDPEASRSAQAGLFLIEVFPALALPAFRESFAQRLGGPKYNPARRRSFKIADWHAVALTVAETAHRLGVPKLADWARDLSEERTPRKAEQDLLDSAICLLVGLIWRACDRGMSAMLGDLTTGYMITPVTPETRCRLQSAADRRGVPFS